MRISRNYSFLIKKKSKEVFWLQARIVLLFTLLEVISFQIIYFLSHHYSTDVVGLFSWIPYWGEKGLTLQLLIPLQFLLLPALTYYVLRTRKANTAQFSELKIWPTNSKCKFTIGFYYLSLVNVFVSIFYQHYINSGEFFRLFLVLLPITSILAILPKLSWRKRKVAHSRLIMLSLIIMFFSIGFLVRNISMSLLFLNCVVVLSLVLLILNFLVQVQFTKRFAFLTNSILIGRNALVILGCSYLLYSKPSGYVQVNAYEDHWYANLVLNRRGGAPFKSFLTEHGIWSDFYRYKIASSLSRSFTFMEIYNTYSLAVRPFEIAVVFLVFLAIARNLLLTIQIMCIIYVTTILMNLEIEYGQMIPFILQVYVCFRYLTNLTSRKNLALYGVMFGIFILWTPQTFPGIVGFLVVIVRTQWGEWQRVGISLLNFLAGCGLGVLGVCSYFGLTSSFIRNVKWEGSGYLFSWGDGINYRWDLGFSYLFLFFAVPTILFFSIAHMTKIILDKEVSEYLALAPLLFGVGSLYMKFLGWPDWHLRQPQILVLWGIVLYVALKFSHDKKIDLGSGPIIYVIVLGVFLHTFGAIQDFARINFSIRENSISNQLGFKNSDEEYVKTVMLAKQEFGKFFSDKENPVVFDLSNEPVSWFGIAGYLPPGGVTKILNLASRSSQLEVIDILNKSEVAGVIWGGKYGIWTWPNGGGWIRQYLLTQYVFENFLPVANSGPYTLFIPTRKELAADLYSLKEIKSLPCELRNLPTKFLPPVTYFPGEKQAFSRDTATNIVLRPTMAKEIYSVKRNSLFVKVSADSSLKFEPNDNTGLITFNLRKSDKFNQIWLANCPSWKLQSKEVFWSIKVSNPLAKVEIAFPED